MKMNKLIRHLVLISFITFFMVVFNASLFAAEPDESGIGGTGVSKPKLSDEIFNRPDIPEIVDIPEVPELSVPELSVPSFDEGVDADFSTFERDAAEESSAE